jgi:hypothetical protein
MVWSGLVGPYVSRTLSCMVLPVHGMGTPPQLLKVERTGVCQRYSWS